MRSAADAAGYRSIAQPVLRAPYIRTGVSLAAYRRSVSHNLRHDVERRLRSLCQAGAVSVQVSDGRERLDPVLRPLADWFLGLVGPYLRPSIRPPFAARPTGSGRLA
jgi:hypothetical protein